MAADLATETGSLCPALSVRRRQKAQSGKRHQLKGLRNKKPQHGWRAPRSRD